MRNCTSAEALAQSSNHRALNPIPVVLRNWGICNHYAVELLAHTPTPEEVHDVGPLLCPTCVYVVSCGSRFDEK